MKISANFFIGVMVAATAGVVIGMLIAPEKGEVLRNNIKDRAGDWTKKLAELLEAGDSRDTLKSAMREANGISNEGKDSTPLSASS
jgi:gas vesicle protein